MTTLSIRSPAFSKENTVIAYFIELLNKKKGTNRCGVKGDLPSGRGSYGRGLLIGYTLGDPEALSVWS